MADLKLLRGYLKAEKFFKKYAKGVKNIKNKMRKTSNTGLKIDFTEDDQKIIDKGLDQFFKDIRKKKK